MNFIKRFYVDDLPASFHEGPRDRWCYMDGGAKTVTTQSNSAPWSGQQPHLTAGFNRASALSQTPAQYFPGSTVVPLSQQTETALGMQEQRALAGSPLLRQAQENVGANLRGELNPAQQGMLQQVMGAARPAVDSRFAGAGRYGSGMHARALSDSMGDAGTRMLYQGYNDAMGMAPGLAQQDYADIGQLASVGQVREQQAGANLQDQIARHNFGQNAQWDALQKYMALVGGGSYGGQSTSQQPIYSNPMMSAAGLGLGGIGALGTLFGQGGIWPQ